MDQNIVEIWLRKDPVRWIAGAFAGAFAGIVMIGVSMLFMALMGDDIFAPIKVAALPVLGASAMEAGMVMKPIVVGLLAHELLCVFLGIIFAHFTGTNVLSALLGVGLTWGIFGWIFINNLFSPSFHDVLTAERSAAVAFFAWVIFGITLTSVSFFDKLFRRS